jgi:hypothetical protein
MPREDLELVLKYRSEAMTPFMKRSFPRAFTVALSFPARRMPAGAGAAIVSGRYQE